MTKPEYVDFSRIEPHHIAIHERLVNWARWVSVKPISVTQPMFRQFSTPRQWDINPHIPTAIDTLDAMLVEKEVYKLPQPHREAVRWFYVHRTDVRMQRKKQGLTASGLALMVRDARTMLTNVLQTRNAQFVHEI